MKKFVRGLSGRAVCMLVLAIFLIPTLLLPFAVKGYASLDRQNILLLPLDSLVADTPASLTATMQQQVAAALMLRTGVQVDVFSKKSPAIRSVEQHLDDAGKEILRTSMETALNANADPNERFKAAAIVGQLLGMDAVIYGSIDGYDLATKNGEQVRQIRLSATAVVIDHSETVDVTQDINAERILLTAKGFSASNAVVHRTAAQLDIEAINALAENLAYQYTGTTVTTSLNSPSNTPEKSTVKRKSYTGWIFGGLTLAAIAMFANGSGSSQAEPPPPPALPAPTGLQASIHYAGGDTYEVWLSWEIAGNVTPTKINIYRTEGVALSSRIASFIPSNFTKHAVAHRSTGDSRASSVFKKQSPTNIRDKGVMAAGVAEVRGVVGGLTRAFIDRPVALDTNYLYEIEAVYGNVSVRSATFPVSTVFDQRNYSSNIIVADVDGNVSIDWDSAGAVSFYRIFRSISYDPSYDKATQDDLNRYFKQIADVRSLSYLNTITEYGKTYSYVVVPYYSTNDPYLGVYQVDSVTPVRLLGSVTPNSYTQLDYSTTYPITAIIKDINGKPIDKVDLTFQFETNLPIGTTLQITKQTDATGTAVSNLVTGKAYGYGRVVVFWDKDGDGRLDVSTNPSVNELVGRTGYLVIGLASPTGVTASLINNTKVQIRWNPALYGPYSTPPDAYYVERRVDLAGTWTVISSALSTNSFIDTTVEAGKTYEYRVYSMLDGLTIQSPNSGIASIILAFATPESGTLSPTTTTYRVITPSTDFPITVNTVGAGGQAVGAGNVIRFILTKIYGSNSASLDVYTKETDAFGTAQVVLRPGADYGRLTVEAYYDKNANGVMDAGESFGSTGVLVVGLAQPANLTAVYNSATGTIDLRWPQFGVNQQYGDGFIVERQMEGDANWLKLPPTGTVVTPGVTVDLNKTLNTYTYSDSYLLVPGKKYTYRVKTIVIESGIESAMTSSQPILLPLLEPITGVITPVTASYTIIDPTIVQPITVTALDKNSNPVGAGIIIKFQLTRDFQAATATLSAAQATTDASGMVSVNLTPGTAFGKVTVQAFYDRNGNSIIDAAEAMGTPVKLVLGLVKPVDLNAAYNAITGNVNLSWTALNINEQFGDGFVIERQKEGDTTWLRLPATAPVAVPGLTVNLNATSFTDNYNLQTGTKYTYRIKTVSIASGLESGTTSSVQILVPQLEPFSANIDPVTPDFTIIDPAVVQPITLTALDKNGRPVGAGFVIKFRLTKNYNAANATISAASATTDANGAVTVNMTAGAAFGKVTILAFYDKNGNGTIDAGEVMGTPVKFVLGLVKPVDCNAVFNATTGNVDLSWTALNSNEQFGDGFVIERQKEGDTTWLRLPATSPVSVPGLTVNLNASAYTDGYNLQSGTKYTYRIKTVAVAMGLESGATSSVQILIPQLEPFSADIDPVTTLFTIIDPAVVQPITLTILDKNGRPVVAGFVIKFRLTKNYNAANATISAASATTDANGVVSVNLTAGAAFGKVTVQAYFDKNGNNAIDAGEAMGTSVKFVLGLMKPVDCNAVYNAITGNVNISWTGLNSNELYGDGFVIERQKEAEANWVRLPATGAVSVPGLTANLNASSYTDSYNLQSNTKYTYRIKTVVIASGLESATTSSLQIQVPQYEPVTANIDPFTASFTIIDPAVVQPITLTVLDKNGRPVGAGFVIKFRLTKNYNAANAALSAASATTDANGIVTVNMTPGAAFGKVTVLAYYDKNGNNIIDSGETMGTAVQLVLGLVKPADCNAVYNAATGNVDLSWPALNINEQYGDGFVIERQKEAEANWIRLPATAPVSAPGLTVNLTANSFTDNYNLQNGTKYTYRIKTVGNGLESGTTSSLQILVPLLEPVSANIDPITTDFTIIDPAVVQPITLTILDKNGRPVGAGFVIKFRLTKNYNAANATISAASATTDAQGVVTVNMTSGAAFGKVTVQAYYDKNGNNIIDAGEAMGTPVKLVLGLMKPVDLNAVYNATTGNVDLNWTALSINEQYGDGLVIERQKEGDTIWLRLPATAPVSVPGVTVNLNENSYTDTFNLQSGMKYTYRIKTVVVANGFESAATSSLQIVVPQLEPVSANINPITADFAIIDPAVVQPITLTILDKNDRPVGAGFVIKFRLIKNYGAANATLSAASATTDANGLVTVNMTAGAAFGKITIQAYYDKNGNNIINTGEQMGSDVKFVLGLLKPNALIAQFNSVTTAVDLSWPALNVNGLYGDGLLIERQMEGSTVWVALPAAGGAVAGTSATLSATSYADNFNLQFGKKYTYRIKNVDLISGFESADTTSSVISLPDLPPDTTTTVIPATQIAVQLSTDTTFTFMVQRNGVAVNQGFNIMFKLRRIPNNMTASLNVSAIATDIFGIAKVTLKSGTVLGEVYIEAYFDSNNNGIAEASELLKSTAKIIVGLNPPTNLSGSFNVVTKKPHLSWTAALEGEGYIIQRRRISPLPTTTFTDVATLPGLTTTQWDDNVNPLPGHKYEYQILTYWQTDNDVLSAPSTAVSVTLPSLMPTSGVFVPDVPVGETFIFVARNGSTSFSFVAVDSSSNPVATADIAFRKKIVSGSSASVTVPAIAIKTDIDGKANFDINVGNALVIFQLEAYFDTNNNGFYEPSELIATTGSLTSGVSDPTSVSVLGVVPASIKVSWLYNNLGGFADTFTIERQIDGGTWDILRTQPVADPKNFTDTQLDPSKVYSYRVTAENSQYFISSNAVESAAINPPADQIVNNVAVSLLTPAAGKIYFSEDSDDQLAVGLATRSTLQITGTAGAKASAYAVVSLTTSRGRFLQTNPSQVLSNGNQTLTLTLDGSGKANVVILGRADNGITDGFMLPATNEFGKPTITVVDNTAKQLVVTGGSDFLTTYRTCAYPRPNHHSSRYWFRYRAI